jgi:hypothetical protein
VVVFLYPQLAARPPRSRYFRFGLQVAHEDGRGILWDVLAESTRLGFSIARVHTHQLEREVRGASAVAGDARAPRPADDRTLALALSGMDGVLEVTASDLDRGIG